MARRNRGNNAAEQGNHPPRDGSGGQSEKEARESTKRKTSAAGDDELPDSDHDAPEPGHEPNLIFIGRRMATDKETGDSVMMDIPAQDAPTWLRDGSKKPIRLPDGETQAAGFYHSRAAEILRAWPSLYKRLVKKGE